MPNHDAISRMPWPDRFWARVEKTATCWLWHGARAPLGYGYCKRPGDRRHSPAHRISLELSGVTVPRHLVCDHLCNNPPCVNPDHLRVCTQRENIARGSSPAAWNIGKTHCPKGHPYDESNTIRTHRGRHRACKKCARARVKEYVLKNHDKMIAYWRNYNLNFRGRTPRKLRAEILSGESAQ